MLIFHGIYSMHCHTVQVEPGWWFNIKISSYQYRKSQCGDKTILWPSYLHNGISYRWHWISTQISIKPEAILISTRIHFKNFYKSAIFLLSSGANRTCWIINTLRPGQNGCHFTDDIFKCVFFNENAPILIKISLKFVPRVPNNNIQALVQIMAWCWPGNKPLFEPVMA